MKIIEVADYRALSKVASEIIIKQVQQKPNAVLGLATGGTPIGTYRYLVEDYQKNQTSYHKIHTINLDEYIGLNHEDSRSYSYYMNDHLFQDINIPPEQTILPNATNSDCQKESEKYEERIESLGGIDLQILGLGENGHIGFNEPGTSFASKTRVVKLTESTRNANARYFQSIDEVPTYAISMGIATIMKSKEIILLVSGKNKATILTQLLTSNITEELPASILKTHPNVTVIADKDALSLT